MEDDDCKFVVPSTIPSDFYDWLENNINQKQAKPLEIMEVDKE